MPLTHDFKFECSTCGAVVDIAVDSFQKACCAVDFHYRLQKGEFDRSPDLAEIDLHRMDDDGAPHPPAHPRLHPEAD